MNVLKDETTAVQIAVGEQDLRRLQRLIERVIVQGSLSRQEEDEILSEVMEKTPPSVEKCQLYRELQERVWLAEVYLSS